MEERNGKRVGLWKAKKKRRREAVLGKVHFRFRWRETR
jgi:hypothetical protein